MLCYFTWTICRTDCSGEICHNNFKSIHLISDHTVIAFSPVLIIVTGDLSVGVSGTCYSVWRTVSASGDFHHEDFCLKFFDEFWDIFHHLCFIFCMNFFRANEAKIYSDDFHTCEIVGGVFLEDSFESWRRPVCIIVECCRLSL